MKHFASLLGSGVLLAGFVVPVAHGQQTSAITINGPMIAVNGVALTLHFYSTPVPACPLQPINCNMQAGLICSTGIIPCNQNAGGLAAAMAGDINTACNAAGITAVANGSVVTITKGTPFWCCVADDNNGVTAWPLDTCSPLNNICNANPGDETLNWVVGYQFQKTSIAAPVPTMPNAFALVLLASLLAVAGLVFVLFVRRQGRPILPT